MAATRRARVNRTIAITAGNVVRKTPPEARPVDWFDEKTPGLALRVSPTGARTWFLLYRAGGVGTVRRLKLGAFHETKFSVPQARDAAAIERGKIRTGADPVAERKTNRAAETVGDLIDKYIEFHAKPNKKSWKSDDWKAEKFIRPAWGDRPIKSITRADVHTLLDPVRKKYKVAGKRLKALVSRMWTFALDRGYADVHVCYRMTDKRETPRRRVLDDDELRALDRGLAGISSDASTATRLRLLTGKRGGEVFGMQWSELAADGDRLVWTIPPARAKNGEEDRVPLVGAALAIVQALAETREKDATLVFPGLRAQSDDALALRKIHGDAYRWHDLRRTMATRLAGLGFTNDELARVLNHKRTGVTNAVYNVHAYDAEKREMLEAWDRELARILSNETKPSADVVPMRRRRIISA